MIINSLITVIIPAYNVAPYIDRCVRSVINQTYKNLQVIIVDDGSTDGTNYICDALLEIDKRITVFHQKNKGLSSARNVGLDNAKGEWIAFLDSDDWIEPDMLEVLIHLAVVNGADIASCKTRFCTLNSVPPPVTDTLNVTILSSDDMIKGLMTQEVVRFEVWNKLWRRDLIGKLRFKIGQVSEDIYWDRILFFKANYMVHIDKTLHNYLVQRPGSTLSSFKVARFCVFEEFDEWIKDLKQNKNDYLIDVIALKAAEYSMSMYCEAIQAKQGIEIKEKLRLLFKNYYKITKNSINRPKKSKLALTIFNFSPILFFLMIRIKIFVKNLLKDY